MPHGMPPEMPPRMPHGMPPRMPHHEMGPQMHHHEMNPRFGPGGQRNQSFRHGIQPDPHFSQHPYHPTQRNMRMDQNRLNNDTRGQQNKNYREFDDFEKEC